VIPLQRTSSFADYQLPSPAGSLWQNSGFFPNPLLPRSSAGNSLLFAAANYSNNAEAVRNFMGFSQIRNSLSNQSAAPTVDVAVKRENPS